MFILYLIPCIILLRHDLARATKKLLSVISNRCLDLATCTDIFTLTALISEIFREEFKKQQKNLLLLISGNLEITMKEMKSIKSEMYDFKKSIEFTEN